MARKTTFGTIWYIPDDLWDKVRPLLGPEKQPGTVGRPPIPHRTCLDGILYVLRTGCQWKRAPGEFGSGLTLHRRFQAWVGRGVFRRVWRLLLKEYDELRGIQWRWQAIDSATMKAPLGGAATGKSPVDRGKSGTKQRALPVPPLLIHMLSPTARRIARQKGSVTSVQLAIRETIERTPCMHA
jgi:transposase